MPSLNRTGEGLPRGRGRPRIPRRIKVVPIRRDYPDIRKLAQVLRGLAGGGRHPEQHQQDGDSDDQST